VGDWIAARAASLAAAANVEVLTRTTAVGHFHHNWVLLFERLGDDDPAGRRAGAPRHRLWKVRANRIVLATGAIERPIPFANNDRPGVMLASAARGFASRYGVSPGATGVIFTNNDDAWRTALELKRAGASIAAIVDSRANPAGALIEEARGAGLRIETGSAIAGLVSARGGKDIEAVKVSAYRSGGRVLAEEKIACDWVGVSGGFNPVVHLWCHNGGKLAWDDRIASYRPGQHHDAIVAAGAASGVFDLASCLDSGYAAGDAGAGKAKRSYASVAVPAEAAMEPMWFAPASAPYTAGNKHFIDYQNDVTVADLELAQREGYTSVEHTKRYTTWSMATDQGKTSNIAGLGVLSQATGKSVPEIGITTFRPPYTPFSFGSIAGLHTKGLFLPVRQTPVFDWHVANGATFEPVGQWRRAYCYPKAGETKEQAIHREVLAVRRKVGILDASTLGKIEIRGPDAGTFLDRMYTNVFSTLAAGKCRYGLMLNELGFLTDDGVTVRLADDHFLMHTTSGGADRIAAWLEEWLQTEWPDLKVFVTPVTEQWAQFAVAGPMARQTIERLPSDIDFRPESFPFMTFRAGTLDGVPVRVFRISFSGEQSFEIACPAGYGRALWEALLAAGREFGIEPYGTEALHILRAEKGYIVIGDETDGTVTPHDVGLSGLVSKKKADFVGKRSLEQSFLKGPNRKQLVGLLTADPNEVLPDGAHAVREVKDKPPMETIGHVTSTYMSPTLGRSIAMALIQNGRSRMGETLSFPLEGGRVVKATICDPVFYDKEGARQNG
jgi:sarcosine oxidase subunit alpha